MPEQKWNSQSISEISHQQDVLSEDKEGKRSMHKVPSRNGFWRWVGLPHRFAGAQSRCPSSSRDSSISFHACHVLAPCPCFRVMRPQDWRGITETGTAALTWAGNPFPKYLSVLCAHRGRKILKQSGPSLVKARLNVFTNHFSKEVTWHQQLFKIDTNM